MYRPAKHGKNTCSERGGNYNQNIKAISNLQSCARGNALLALRHLLVNEIGNVERLAKRLPKLDLQRADLDSQWSKIVAIKLNAQRTRAQMT